MTPHSQLRIIVLQTTSLGTNSELEYFLEGLVF